jgi:lysophospholipase L1-like esterase
MISRLPDSLFEQARFTAVAWHRAFMAFLVMMTAATAIAQQPSTAQRWERQIRAHEKKDRENPPAPGGVLFIGSSSIRMWKNLPTDFPSANAINRGFGGAQIADCIFYADRLVMPYRPRKIIFYAGDNDLADGRTPAGVVADFSAFVERVRRDFPTMPIAFVSIKPSPAREDLLPAIRAVNAILRRMVSRMDNVSYIDVFRPMLTPDGQARDELFKSDGLHLNRQGYLLWRQVIGPHLDLAVDLPDA